MSQTNLFQKIYPETTEGLWAELFSKDNIKAVFYEDIYPKGGQGVDRISVREYEKLLNNELEIINRKVLQGTYKFSPYLEQLQSKGKSSLPRVISIPTTRDKLVLKILTEFLHVKFKDNLAKDLPNTVIKKIKKEIFPCSENIAFLKLDIQNFYPSVQHEILLNKICKKIDYKPFLNILRKAIRNPTLPAGYKHAQRKDYNTSGVPQGLSISNILAEIYVGELDDNLTPLSKAYFRFVDDIFILCEPNNGFEIWTKTNEIVNNLKLKINHEKSTEEFKTNNINEKFDFLGYSFDVPQNIISVSKKSQNKFINSLVNKITKFKYGGTNVNKNKPPEIIKKVFIEDLNERITGAVDKKRRYGWAFFFSEINDQQLLNKIDMIIHRVLQRVPNFNKEDIQNVKKVNRAYYEAKHTPTRGYIHNYNEYKTLQQKIDYLRDRGMTKADAQYTEEQINNMFNKIKASNLLKLEQDITNLS